METKLSLLYREHLIYRRNKERIYAYLCLENITEGGFAVHQLEIIFESRVNEAMNHMRELFFENMIFESPDERLDWFPTLVGAIDAHDSDFDN